MTSKKTVIQLLLLCGALGLSSCAGKPPAATVSQVSQAELAVQQASKSKAPDYASLELYTAREQFAGAQEALHKKEYTQARRLGRTCSGQCTTGGDQGGSRADTAGCCGTPAKH